MQIDYVLVIVHFKVQNLYSYVFVRIKIIYRSVSHILSMFENFLSLLGSGNKVLVALRRTNWASNGSEV